MKTWNFSLISDVWGHDTDGAAADRTAGLRFERKLPAASEINTGQFHSWRCSMEVKKNPNSNRGA